LRFLLDVLRADAQGGQMIKNMNLQDGLSKLGERIESMTPEERAQMKRRVRASIDEQVDAELASRVELFQPPKPLA
jgi:hypothetical protein